jgi:D-3-phosphoglycerate dehydrogenase
MNYNSLYKSFNVLITDPVDNTLIEGLKSIGVKVDYRPNINREELLKIIKNYDILVVRSRTLVNKEIIDNGINLKIIARAGVGTDNIDVDEANKKGIKVIYAPGASTHSTAELTIGLIIIAARNLYNAINLTKNGIFKKIEGMELYGKTLGIVGLGRIGSKVSQIGKSLGMNVIAYDILDMRGKAKELGVEVVKLEDLLRNSDIISFHVTVDKNTKPILTRERFEILKDGVIIVNTSRAIIIDGRALLEHLEKGKVGFYATDVLWNEPPKEEWELKLLKHERVIVSPHIGAQTKEAQARIAKMLLENLIKTIEELTYVTTNSRAS